MINCLEIKVIITISIVDALQTVCFIVIHINTLTKHITFRAFWGYMLMNTMRAGEF